MSDHEKDIEHNKDATRERKGGCLSKIAFALLLLFMAGTAWYFNESVKAIRQEISQLRSLAVRPSAELEERISRDLEKFVQETAGTATPKLVTAVQNDARVTLREIGDSAKASLKAFELAATNRLDSVSVDIATLKMSFAGLKENVCEVGNSIARWQDEPVRDVQMLLDAASSAAEPELRCLYLESALRTSKDKSSIMEQLIKIRMQKVDELRAAGSGELADAEFNRIIGPLAEAKRNASVVDVRKLLELEKIVESKRSAGLQDDDAGLGRQGFADRIAGIADYEAGQALRGEILADQHLGDDDKDELDDELMNKLACMTSPEQPIVIPSHSPEFPYEEWLGNIMMRFTNENISVEERAADYMKAEEFLAQADKGGMQTNVLARIKPVGVELYSRCWVNHAKSAIAGMAVPEKKKDSLATISEMISQAGAFTKDQQLRVRDTIVGLHRAVLNEALEEVKTGMDDIWDLKGRLGEEDIRQLAGVQHANCLQMLCRLQGLCRQYPGAFDLEMNVMLEKANSLSMMVSGYRDMAVAEEKTRQKEQRSKFLTWAKGRKDYAEKMFARAEKIAAGWTRTRKNQDAQMLYLNAWNQLIRIDPNDLAVVDPALNRHVQELIGKIEECLDKKLRDLTNVKYMRISDF